MKELTLYQFNALDDINKIDLLERRGVYLSVNRYEGNHKIALFAIYGFYVEVWYNKTTDALDKLNAFDSYKRLEEYISSINIEAIYSLL